MGMGGLDVRAEVQQRSNAAVQRRLDKGIWTRGGCTSWYLDAAGVNRTIWPGFTVRYWWETRRFDPTDFEFFGRAADAAATPTPEEASQREDSPDDGARLSPRPVGSRRMPLPPGTARPVVAAGALFRDAAGRVLLVHPTYKPGWDVPGGVVEDGESPAEACRREIAEELGLDRATGAFLSVDHTARRRVRQVPVPLRRRPGSATTSTASCWAPDELDRWAWVAPADLADHLPPPLYRRVTSTARRRRLPRARPAAPGDGTDGGRYDRRRMSPSCTTEATSTPSRV